MSDFINTLNGYLWGPIMIVLCLGVAIIYSVVLKFPQIRLFKSMVHYLTKGSSSENGISSFQGFAMALGGRVGVGNIAGVATAIFYGGPGALFWMWVYALLGAASAFAESTAGQIWKTEDNGEYCGGPAQYIARGLRCKPLAILYALAAVLAFGLTGPTVQSYNIADSMRNAFHVPPLVTGIVIAILFAVIVAGGAKRIGSFASYVVPFMAGVYIVLMIIILGTNITRVPAMFGLIFRCAFNKEAAFGAIFGSTIMWGVKRGVYSSEAGQGSGAQASSAAEVSHPVKQGLAQAFSVYIDTLVVCTATGLMILAPAAITSSTAPATRSSRPFPALSPVPVTPRQRSTPSSPASVPLSLPSLFCSSHSPHCFRSATMPSPTLSSSRATKRRPRSSVPSLSQFRFS